MKKPYYKILLFLLVIIGAITLLIALSPGAALFLYKNNKNTSSPDVRTISNSPQAEQTSMLGDTEAENTGYGFILNFIKSAPPVADSKAQENALRALSKQARERISSGTESRDLAGFVGVQDVPDQGVSVENLRLESSSEAVLTVGLNYSGARVLKEIWMIAENGKWAVDDVKETETASP